jgi:hypothetical protein
MDMNRLNVFRRLDERETANLHLQVMLKSTRLELEALRSGVTILHNAIRRPVDTPVPEAKAAPKPKKRKTYTTEALRKKRRDYARAYAARKRAEKLAVMP